MPPFDGTQAFFWHVEDRHRQCARAFENQTLAALHGRHAQISYNRWKICLQAVEAFTQVGAYSKQDLLALVAADIEWINSGEGWPLAGTRRGHWGFATVLQKAS